MTVELSPSREHILEANAQETVVYLFQKLDDLHDPLYAAYPHLALVHTKNADFLKKHPLFLLHNYVNYNELFQLLDGEVGEVYEELDCPDFNGKDLAHEVVDVMVAVDAIVMLQSSTLSNEQLDNINMAMSFVYDVVNQYGLDIPGVVEEVIWEKNALNYPAEFMGIRAGDTVRDADNRFNASLRFLKAVRRQWPHRKLPDSRFVYSDGRKPIQKINGVAFWDASEEFALATSESGLKIYDEPFYSVAIALLRGWQ